MEGFNCHGRLTTLQLPVSHNEVVNPLCIVLVKNGSKGDRLLFRFPFKRSSSTTSSVSQTKESAHPQLTVEEVDTSSLSAGNQTYPVCPSRLPPSDLEVPRPAALSSRRNYLSKQNPNAPFRSQNPYAIRAEAEDEINGARAHSNTLASGRATISMELSEKDLSNLLAVKDDLSERKFELKVKDVRFVGHPTLMQHPSLVRPMNAHIPPTSTRIFHVAFCLHAMASHSIVKCFYDLSKRIGIALRHEEYRCGYLSQEMKLIISHLDQACQEQEEDEESTDSNYFQYASKKILQHSSLARLLKAVYEDVCRSGFIQLRVNNWVQLSFCLPQKIHVIPFRPGADLVEPEIIHRSIESIRPYHAILLLVDREELCASFMTCSSSGSGSIGRLLQVYSPLKSLQVTAADADMSLCQVVEIASHLVYWAVALLIYPMCETNVYVIASDAPIMSPQMQDSFLNSFPGISLTQTMADFSHPIPLGERVNPVLGGSYLQAQLVQLVCWLLQYRLLTQLHTYTYLLPALHENGIHNAISDGHDLFKNEVRLYEHDEEENTVSDSYSEIAAEEVHISAESLFGTGLASTSVAAAAILEHAETEAEGGGVEQSEGNAVDPVSGKNTDELPETTIEETLRKLSVSARRAIDAVKPDLTIPEIKLFARLSKYFNGEFHFEEIMYRENVRRSQLLLLVDKFRTVLVVSEREDPAINFFKTKHW